MTAPVWLFGYGSIMWKTGFDFEESRLGFIRDRARRFWQGSMDHRGTPDFPGRVVTLIDSPGDICWGMAYRIPAAVVAETMCDLDYREKGGYVREDIAIEFKNGNRTQAVTYHARTDNPNFLGHAAAEDIARQIALSMGPSGSNKEYILQLHQTLKAHDIVDDHVNELTRLVSCFPEDVKNTNDAEEENV